jgi:hypothetical protein
VRPPGGVGAGSAASLSIKRWHFPAKKTALVLAQKIGISNIRRGIG